MSNLTSHESLTSGKRWRVLLVDDEEFNHEILELSLNKTDFSLVSAINVAEAMRVMVSDPPDILITDAMMPGESGFSLIEKVRARPETANMPIILWTILEQPDGSVMDASRKADFMVSKPFYLSSILETLEKAKEMAELNALTASKTLPATLFQKAL
ncbi:MAG: response regulator [Acidobacteria bacterium]|nr:response regulator [Acidobacteriota bacterium]